MQTSQTSILPEILIGQERAILDKWIRVQLSAVKRKSEFLSEAALRPISSDFLRLLQEACQQGNLTNIKGVEFEPVRKMLDDLSASRVVQGFSPSETASFIFSLKKPLFDELNDKVKDPNKLAEQIWLLTELIDALGLYTSEVYQRSREDVIKRQQRELLELSTPVIKVWDGILCLPLIGTLDSARTQIIMEVLLEKIVEQSASIAILDITGVPTVDTQTAQHLVKTVAAARLMGAECIISGIRPQIAQTIVHLGIDISDITTKSSMADALPEAFYRLGMKMKRVEV